MYINKIIKYIYLEKDEITNISLFVSSMVALVFYFHTNDIVLTTISFIGSFSFIKVISGIFVGWYKRKQKRGELFKNFSGVEKDAIKAFISRGSCFMSWAGFEKTDIERKGIDSLVARGFVNHIDDFGRPQGFMLNEDIYKSFLDSNKCKHK